MRSRICAFLLTVSLLAAALPLSGAAADSRVIGGAAATDVAVFIDWMPIESFDIGGYTYVRAEDLRDYGFDVVWNPEARTLSIAPNGNLKRASLPVEKINIKKDDISLEDRIYDLYETDVRADIMGEPIEIYCTGDTALIHIDELARCGGYSWDQEKKQIWIHLLRDQLDREMKGQENETISRVEDPSKNENFEYVGLPEGDRQLNGVAKIRRWTFDVGSNSVYGRYRANQREGVFFEEEIRMLPPATYCWYRLSRYQDGVKSGSCISYEEEQRAGEETVIRIEREYYNGRATGEGRRCRVDSAYLYGYYVEQEGRGLAEEMALFEQDPDGTEAAYIAVEEHAALRADGQIVTWDNGYQYFGFGYALSSQSKPAVEITESCAGLFYRTQEGELYHFEDFSPEHPDGIERLVAEKVTGIEGNTYQTEDGVTWYYENGESYSLGEKSVFPLVGSYYGSIDTEGTLWGGEISRNEDGIPMFAEHDKILTEVVQAKGSCALRADGTLWVWYYRVDLAGNHTILTLPQKIADEVAEFAARPGCVVRTSVGAKQAVLYLDTAGDMWAFGENVNRIWDMEKEEYGRLGVPKEQKYLSVPRKVMEGVKAISLGDCNGSAIDRDGVLYVFGKEIPLNLAENSECSSVQQPVITQTYRRLKESIIEVGLR